MAPRRPLEERFWEKVDIRGASECWPWTGARFSNGYGAIKVDGKQEKAHRISLKLAGRDPGPLDACHHCDNPPCVNPQHLWIGTQKDNTQDCIAKGRWKPARKGRNYPGEDNSTALLTNDQVRELRKLYADGTHRQCELARHFSVSPQVVWTIVHDINWKTIK